MCSRKGSRIEFNLLDYRIQLVRCSSVGMMGSSDQVIICLAIGSRLLLLSPRALVLTISVSSRCCCCWIGIILSARHVDDNARFLLTLTTRTKRRRAKRRSQARPGITTLPQPRVRREMQSAWGLSHILYRTRCLKQRSHVCLGSQSSYRGLWAAGITSPRPHLKLPASGLR